MPKMKLTLNFSAVRSISSPISVSTGSMAAAGEDIPWKELHLLHLAYYILQAELAGICFSISAFFRKGSAGAGNQPCKIARCGLQHGEQEYAACAGSFPVKNTKELMNLILLSHTAIRKRI